MHSYTLGSSLQEITFVNRTSKSVVTHIDTQDT